jgi:hypothetical protein
MSDQAYDWAGLALERASNAADWLGENWHDFVPELEDEVLKLIG